MPTDKAITELRIQQLREYVCSELRDQGFDVGPQLQLRFPGFWFKSKFWSFDDLDSSTWGYPDKWLSGESER